MSGRSSKIALFALMQLVVLSASAAGVPGGTEPLPKTEDILTPESKKTCVPNAAANMQYMRRSKCVVAVLLCNICMYDEKGNFRKDSLRPCGVCFGGGF